MMTDYKRIPTSAEVWAVIKARHPNLRVFSSFSDPDGTFNGGPGELGRMETAYGFAEGDYPIMEARTTWDIDSDQPGKRLHQNNEYWLCVPIKETE